MRLWHGTDHEVQRGDELSHVGGTPLLPIGMPMPVCPDTGRDMTFFFQLQISRPGLFEGRVVSFFAVTDHVDDEAYLPALSDPLREASLTSAFFAEEPRFYRLLCFDPARAERAATCREAVTFRRLRFGEDDEREGATFGRIGPKPDWILDDEAPRSFNGRAAGVEFLFQTELDYEFATVPGAPRQRVRDYSVAGDRTCDSLSDTYDLFVSNALFVFGLRDGAEAQIYVVPQS